MKKGAFMQFLDLKEKRKALNKKIHETMVKAFPINSHVGYKHGENLIMVEILEHNDYGESLYVKGDSSGKKYWLDADRICIMYKIKRG